MPTPIRPNPQPTRPTGPTGPTGPAPTTTPSAPVTFPANLDSYDVRGGAAPRLPQPVQLGDFDGQKISINAQGRLVLPNDSGKLDDSLAAHRAILKGADGKNPFAALTDKAALKAVVDRLAVMHKAGTADAADDKQILDQRTLRATSLSLMELAAMRAGELGDAPLQQAMLKQMLDAVKKEPFRALKDFAYESLVARADEKTLPAIKDAQEAVYPSKPPTDKMLKDGTLKIAYYIDNEGSELNYQLSYMRSLGFKQKKLDAENYVFTKEASGGKPKIEVLFKSPKTHEDKPHLFEKMDDPSVDIIAYTGHAGYGHRVDDAINQGMKGTGDGKLVVLMQCWGVGNVESLERAFPDAHVVSTTEPSTDNHDQFMFEKLLNGVLGGKGYDSMQKEVVSGMKNAWWKGDADPDKHFFFPTNRNVVGEKVDRDRDGVRDLTDHVFNVVYPKRLDAAGGYDPVAQPIADDALDGSQASKAVNTLSLVMRYNSLLPQAAATKVKWGPDNLQTAGFFTPKDGDLKAFQFSRDAAGKLNVALSTRFAHTDGGDLSKMLAYEAGQFLGKEAGLDDKGSTALALTMYERAAHQEADWKWSKSVLDEPWAEETMLASRYGLDGVTVADLSEAIGHAEDLTDKHTELMKKLVERSPALSAAAGKTPVRVGEALTVPAGLRLAAGDLSNQALQRVMNELGVAGKVESYGPTYLSAGEANNLAVVVRDAAGKTQQIGLSLDTEGVLRGASRVDLQVDKVKERTGRAYLGEVAKALNKEPKALLDAYAAQLRAGKVGAEAVAATLEAERKNIPLDAELPELKAFDQLRTYGLTTTGENAAILETMARLYPRGEALAAQKAVFTWAEAAPGVNKDALRKTYLEALAASGSRDGAGKALEAVFARLPRPLPAGFPMRAVLAGGLVSPAALPGTLKAWQQASGAPAAALAQELALAWMPQYSDDAAVKTALKPLVDANAGGKAIFDKALETLHPDKWNVPAYDTALLQELGVLSAQDAAALNQKLAALRQ